MWTVNANGYVRPKSFPSQETAKAEVDKIFKIDRNEAAMQGDWAGIENDHVTLSKGDEVVAVSGLIEVANGFDIALIPQVVSTITTSEKSSQ